MRDTFISALLELAKEDPDLLLLTGDLGFGVLESFSNTLPRQFINCGVSEQNMTGLACGLALEGKRVVTYSIGNFNTLRPLEQIRNDLCYHNANVTIVSVGAGFSYGQLGMSHFATEDIAILRALPNMSVYSPCDKWEIPQFIRSLIYSGGPSYLRLDKGDANTPPCDVIEGKIRTLKKSPGIALLGTGSIVSELVIASSLLNDMGIKSSVHAVSSLKPFDIAGLLDIAREASALVTVEEHNLIGGLKSIVSEALLGSGVAPTNFLGLGIPDVYPSVVGDQGFLREYFGLDGNSIAETVAAEYSRWT